MDNTVGLTTVPQQTQPSQSPPPLTTPISMNQLPTLNQNIPCEVQPEQPPKQEEESDHQGASVPTANIHAQKQQESLSYSQCHPSQQEYALNNEKQKNIPFKGHSANSTTKEETIELPQLKDIKTEEIKMNIKDAIKCLRAIRRKIPSEQRLKSILTYMDQQLTKRVEDDKGQKGEVESEQEVVTRSFLNNGYGMAVIRLYDCSIGPGRYNYVITTILRNVCRKLQEQLLLQGLEVRKFQSTQEYLLRAPLIAYKSWMKPKEVKTFRKLLSISKTEKSFSPDELISLHTAISDKLEERLIRKNRK